MYIQNKIKHFFSLGPLAFVWPANQSRNTRDLIFPQQKTSLLSPDVCKNSGDGSSPPYLLGLDE